MKAPKLIALLTAMMTTAAIAQPAERWFEIEVLLFSHLDGQEQLHEQFGTDIQTIDSSVADQLIRPYLVADVSLIKNHLPLCDTATSDTLDTKPKEVSIVPLWDFTEPYQIVDADGIEIYSGIAQHDFDQLDVWLEQIEASNIEDADLATQTVNPTYPVVMDDTANANDSAETNAVDDGLTEEQRKQNFIDTRFIPLDIWQPTTLSCVFYEEVVVGPDVRLVRHNDIDFNSLPFDSVPRLLNGDQISNSGDAYVVSSDQLQLTDIYDEMRRSKQFSPKLHIAWRQSVLPPKTARSNHLFAGVDYKERFNAEGIEVVDVPDSPVLLNSYFEEQKRILDNMTPEQLALMNDSQQVTREKMIADINAILLNPTAAENQVVPVDNEASASSIWEYDGLFKVHVEHYLFIEIDMLFQQPKIAELIASQTEQMSLEVTGNEPRQHIQSYRMLQTRRVISGEIHYFDHPYFGMVVQIRRFDPEKFKQEWETQQQTEQTVAAW